MSKKPVSTEGSDFVPAEYPHWLSDIKQSMDATRQRAVLAGNWAATCCPITLISCSHSVDQTHCGRMARVVRHTSRRTSHAGTPNSLPAVRAPGGDVVSAGSRFARKTKG
jgi:hypothetical protein